MTKKLLLLFPMLFMLLLFSACKDDATNDAHTFSAEWSSNAIDHWHICTDEGCTAFEGKSTHIFTSTEVDKAATGTTAGEEGFSCSVCGYAQTLPFYAMTQTEWEALFAFDNLKIDTQYTTSTGIETYSLLLNDEAVQVASPSFSSFVDREQMLASLDFSAHYTAFSTTDRVSYKAASITIDEQTFTNVIVTLAPDGRIDTMTYDTKEGEKDCSYTHTCGSWGKITVALPIVSATQWGNATSDAALDNYSLDVYTTVGEHTTVEYYQFNGSSYYYCKDAFEEILAQESAGKTVLPEIGKLRQLSADKFQYSTAGFMFEWESDSFSYSEPILGFVGEKAAVATFLCFTEDGQVDEMVVILADGTQIVYDFHSYGTSTPGNPSHAQVPDPNEPLALRD